MAVVEGRQCAEFVFYMQLAVKNDISGFYSRYDEEKHEEKPNDETDRYDDRRSFRHLRYSF